jgi:hypothetical protein
MFTARPSMSVPAEFVHESPGWAGSGVRLAEHRDHLQARAEAVEAG